MLRLFQQIGRRSIISRAIFGAAAFCCLAAFLAVASPALAQQTGLATIGAETGLAATPLPILIARIIRIFLSVLGIIAVVLIIYGGFLWMTAGGDEDKVKKAKTVLRNTVIGLVIIFSSYAITTFILNALLRATGLGGGVTAIADKYAEPFSGSLGAGILESHYPARYAIDIPRNTKIFVTFKQPINPATIIRGWTGGDSGDLNSDNILIFETADVTNNQPNSPLGDTDVVVSFNEEDPTTFVFDPVPLLGDGVDDVNYSVWLGPGIELANGSAAFTGNYSDGYRWTFEVSTEVDLTPPRIVSVIPRTSTTSYARNISVEITFNEAMDPVASTGQYLPDEGQTFTNITVESPDAIVQGEYQPSNSYRTVTFTPTTACGEDPCGDTIFCLPGSDAGLPIAVTARAAPILAGQAPQAEQIGVRYAGLVDAVGNSLDGDGDRVAEGTIGDNSEDPDVADHYTWTFLTNNDVDDRVPEIVHITPKVDDFDVDGLAPVRFTFSLPMKGSTLSSSNVQLWPDPWYEFWFTAGKTDFAASGAEAGLEDVVAYSVVEVNHPTLVSLADGGWRYYSVATNDVKSAYQICMHPAVGPVVGNDEGRCATQTQPDLPYCCNGTPTAAPGCQIQSTLPVNIAPIYLPDSSQ